MVSHAPRLLEGGHAKLFMNNNVFPAGKDKKKKKKKRNIQSTTETKLTLFFFEKIKQKNKTKQKKTRIKKLTDMLESIPI